MFRKSIGIIFILIFVIAVVSPTVSRAIPAFARKYGFSCSTCHIAAPKLKAYGDEFAGNAFQLPDEDEPVRAFRDVGDDRLLLHDQKQAPSSQLQASHGLEQNALLPGLYGQIRQEKEPSSYHRKQRPPAQSLKDAVSDHQVQAPWMN